MRNKKIFVIGFMAALLLTAATTVQAQEKTEKINHVATVGAGATLEFTNISGDVKISGWDRSEISIEAVKSGRGRDIARKMQLVKVEFEQRGDKVECKVHYPDKRERRRHDLDSNMNVSVDFTIHVPRNCKLEDFSVVSGDLEISNINGEIELQVVSGNIEGRKIGGEIDISAVSGDINLDELHGKLEINTTSGDIVLENVTGQLEASVTSGNIDVTAIDLESMEAQTTSGDVTMDVSSPVTFGEFSFKVMSGNVDIRLPEGSAFELYGKTATGNISSDYNLEQSKKIMKKTISGQVGERGADIKISTFDGNITIRR